VAEEKTDEDLATATGRKKGKK